MMRALCCLVGATLWAAAGIADIARPKTLDDTLRLMEHAYLATPQIKDVRIDYVDRSLELVTDSEQTFTGYPDNLHNKLRLAASDSVRQQVLDEHIAASIASILEIAAPEETNIRQLLPVLRPKGYANSGDNLPLSMPFVGDVSIFVVKDSPNGIAFVTKDELDQLALTPEDLFETAKTNIYEQNWTPNLVGDNGLFFLRLDGTFESTLMLVPELWRQLDAQMEDVIAVVAARDLVLVADTGVEGALSRLRAAIPDGENAHSYAISDRLLIWRGDHWAAYQ